MCVRKLMLLSGLATGLVVLGAASPVWAVDSDGDGVNDVFDVCENTPTGTAVDAQGRPLGDVDKDCDTDLEDFAPFQQEFAGDLGEYTLFHQGMTGPLAYVVIDTVPVGDPGNADDTHGDGYGGVAYTYNIGKYEVTNSQYAKFLNAVAASDPNKLYNVVMGGGFGGIIRNGSPGSYTYSPIPGRGDMPVNNVTWYDALRFVNWLHNGQPSGPQDSTTTEDGAYDMSLGDSVVRKPDARVFLPSEDEWYKAAYYKGGGANAGYWDYPTQSDVAPTAEAPAGTDLINGSANYASAVGDLTDAGAYTSKPSDSPYGTFDQGGNVWEWNEAVVSSNRGLRGGAYHNDDRFLLAASHYSAYPLADFDDIGFRVAEVPGPAQ